MSGERPLGKRPSFALGVRDIPWWAGLVGLVVVVYLTASLPSELRPLPVLLTIPAAGERDVPVDTAMEVQFEVGGFRQAFDTADPLVKVTYLDVPQENNGPPARAASSEDTLRVTLATPLKPGRHVQVAVATRYGRDLVWTFYTSSDASGPHATPLPRLP
jgi:hypothetical protein